MHSNEIHLLFTTEFSFLNLLPVNPPLYSLPVSNGQKFLERYINICFSRSSHISFPYRAVLGYYPVIPNNVFLLGESVPKEKGFFFIPHSNSRPLYRILMAAKS